MPRTSITLTLPETRVRWLAAGLAAGMLVAVIAGPAFAPRSILAADPANPPEHTISVTGTGRVVVTPDIADIRLGVTVTSPTVKAARESAAASMTAVIAALKKLGIADKDLQTTGLSLQPNYTYPNGGGSPRLNGYTLSNSLSVTIRDLNKIGDAVDNALAAGATTLDGIAFRVDDPAKAEQQARSEALSQAKAKADTLASGAGVRITGVASISETVAPVPYPMYFGAAAGMVAKDSATPVQVGTNEVVVTVAVSYLIG
jgi:uncharacterized protein YggE